MLYDILVEKCNFFHSLMEYYFMIVIPRHFLQQQLSQQPFLNEKQIACEFLID
jgi:hypothetical protein